MRKSRHPPFSHSLFFIPYFLLLLISSCTEPAAKTEQVKTPPAMPEIADCDSANILYYHEPGDPRFYTRTKLYDRTLFQAFSHDVNGTTVTGKDSCVTQGKIYFYGKKDEVYVVYFSRLPSCMTLSFIKTGNKYYTTMSTEIKGLLDEMESKAK